MQITTSDAAFWERFWTRYKAKQAWHSWFAWRPVRAKMQDGHVWVWLERIERKGTSCEDYSGPFWDWEYRIC